jgi:acyl dehydratase
MSNQQLHFEDVEIGYEWPHLINPPISEEQLVRYAGASGDFNQIHYSDTVAKKAGLGGVIAHGALIMGIMGKAITGWVPNECVRQFKVRFVSTTKLGDSITVTGKVIDKKQEGREKCLFCELAASAQNGEVKVSGTFKAALPSRN